MFSPWRDNLGPASVARLAATGWTAPEPDALPTGRELAERYLAPLAALPELKGRVHTHARVLHIGRRGLTKRDAPPGGRAGHPFRLMVLDQGGRENYVHAFAVIDASGVYGQPNRAGDGGIPARGEPYLAPQMAYGIDDVLDLRRARYAGKHALVVGGGASAATVVCDLARLAAEVPGTAVTWVTREEARELYADHADDPPARCELQARARAIVGGADAAVRHVGGAVVDGLQYNSATHRYTAVLVRGGLPASEEADQVIVATGFGPDDAIHRELQVELCPRTLAPLGWSKVLDTGARRPEFGAEALDLGEPNFHVIGAKSHGRASEFALEIGYRQAAAVVARLAHGLEVAAAS
jgi:thioredoxin reductase